MESGCFEFLVVANMASAVAVATHAPFDTPEEDLG